ncbi:MAG TPA: ABC transporter ATP-binding protein [Bacilli bacterium]|nr:ABC transporter ATP-binding protein [Bacilli bacterium]
MLKIFRYLKSSIVSLLLIVGLLVIQAACDLALPDYTSKIVNIGIQQGGIENAAATVITEKTYDNLMLFLDDSKKEYLYNYYDLLETKDYSKYKEYSLLKKENLYKLNTNDKDIKENISDILEVPLMIDYLFKTGKIKEYGFPIPEDVDAYQLLSTLDEKTIKTTLGEMDSKLKEMPESIITSSAIIALKAEYEEIGLNTSKIQTNYILVSGAKMIFISLIIMIDALLIGFFGAKLAGKLGKTLREKVFTKVVSFSKTEMKKFGTASLITRTTNDIQQIQQIVVFLMRVVIYAPIIAVGGIIKTTSKSGSMGWIIFGAVCALFVVLLALFAFVMPKFKMLQKLIDKLNLVAREILNGIPVIRAFNNEKHEENRFADANKTLNKVELFVSRVMALMMPLMSLLMYVVCIAIVWKGAYEINAGTMQVGDIMAYIQYAMQIIFSFLMIGVMSIMLPRAIVSANRILKVLEEEPTIKNPKKIKKFNKNKTGVVEFKNVCFRYPDAMEDVITDVNFKALPGTTTAFIGSTGSGKSTLINLIPRFYDVTEGSILIDGVNIKDVNVKDLRKKIGYIPQKGMLFSGTISSNIKYGNDKLKPEEMIKASKIAQADEFVKKLDDKYESSISQGGTNVSGGQRQRLSIARAIAVNPDIYIFDDSFSALDFKTDAKLRKELSKITKKSTVFIVAQRISTILNADQIVVLNEGNVVGIGKHNELMKNCEVYKEIALSQLSEEELSNVKE